MLYIVGNFASSLVAATLLGFGILTPLKAWGLTLDANLAYLAGSLLTIALSVLSRGRAGRMLGLYSAPVQLLAVASFFAWQSGWFHPALVFLASTAVFGGGLFLRGTRSQLCAERNQLGYAEFAYCGGYLIGLQAGVFGIPVQLALISLAAIVAWFCDYSAARSASVSTEASTPRETSTRETVIGASLFAIFAIGFQVSIQRGSAETGSLLPLSAFELAVTIAPLVYTATRLKVFETQGRTSFLMVTAMSLGIAWFGLRQLGGPGRSLGIGALFVSSFLYEALSLAWFQRATSRGASLPAILAGSGVACTATYFLFSFPIAVEWRAWSLPLVCSVALLGFLPTAVARLRLGTGEAKSS